MAIAPQVPGAALTEFERLEGLPPDHPLAEQWVRVITQDQQGFLWLGTINGLHRFDGYSVLSFHHDPGDPRSLSNNFVNAIFEDSQGALWIATMDGLSRMDDLKTEEEQGQFVTADRAGRFTVFRHDPEDPNSLSEERVYSVAEDRHGELWVATGSGVLRFERESQGFTRFPLKPRNPTASTAPSSPSEPSDIQTLTLVRSRSGDLWLGTAGPILWRLEDSGQNFRPYALPQAGQDSEILWRIAEDASGFLWCGTEGGHLYRFDPRTEAIQSFDLGEEHRGYITTILPQPKGELWLGTDHQGLLILDPATGEIEIHRPSDQPRTLSDVQLSTIFRDRSGILWFGTSAGLDKLDPSKARFSLYRHRLNDSTSLSSNTVNALATDTAGGLWIGTEKGLERMDRNGRITQRYRHDATDGSSLLSNSIGAVLQDHAGHLWVATDQGLDHLASDLQALAQYRRDPTDPNGLISTIYSLVEMDPGTLWIGGHRGLNRLESSTGSLQRYDEPGSVIAMMADAEGQLWLASYGNGLQRFDPSQETFTAYRHNPDDSQSLSSNFLVALHQTRSGYLWIGTLGGGLSRFDPARETFTNYREPDGLTNTNVVGILEDSAGHLWLSTDRGLNRFDPTTETWTRFTVEDGLQGLSFSPGAAWLSPAGEMFFGGTTGLTAFRPEEITTDPLPPPVAITDFLLLNRSTPFAARRSNDSPNDVPRLILDHRDDILAFRFAALHYSKAQHHRYAYQLVGFNDEWVETDARNRLATYTNLDSGDYLFRVKAASSDEVWNEEGASVRLTVLPPPWQTWWAYTAYAFILLAGISVYVRSHQLELRRQRQIAERERQAAERERAVSQRLREVDRMKDNFLANLEGLVQEKMSEIKVLEGILPICSGCKRIREDNGAWSPIEVFIDARSEAQFSHGMCPDCVDRFYEKHPELRSADSG